MANTVLNSLLKEYDHKRIQAELDLEKRKEQLYESCPKLKSIETELNAFAINTAKNILNKNNDDCLKNLNLKIKTLKNQKEQLLQSLGLTLIYLKPTYDCLFCNDTGFILSDNQQTQMCSCLKQRLLDISYNKSNMYNLKNENFSKFNTDLFSDEVNFSKYHQNISPRENILNIKDNCMNFIEHFDDINYKNLLFTGSTGLGKSFMSNCIASELLNKSKTVLYQTAPVLLESIIDYKMSKQKNIQDNIYKTTLEADLLIIDDLGTESQNSMKLSELFTVLNARLLNLNNKVVKTIISTNLGINDIFKFYEERIGSRIAGHYDIYYFFGEDLRFKLKINS